MRNMDDDALSAALRALPDDVAPPRDLRPAIHAAIAARATARRARWPLAAAAVLLVVSTAVTWMAAERLAPRRDPAAARGDYVLREASRELQQTLLRDASPLAAEARALLAENLGAIDRAIRDAATAAAVTDDEGVRRMLAELHARRLELLRQAERTLTGEVT